MVTTPAGRCHAASHRIFKQINYEKYKEAKNRAPFSLNLTLGPLWI